MRLLFIKLRAASSMRVSAHNRLTLLYRCVAAAISQCSTSREFSQLVERASSMRLLFIKLRAASSTRVSAHNRLTLLYRCVAVAISQCVSAPVERQIPKEHTRFDPASFQDVIQTVATGRARYLALGDGHDHCLACLGLAYALIAGT